MPIKLNTASGGGVTLSAANTATDKTITVPADDGTMIYANSSGNVGIGTSSPDNKLHVSQASTNFQIRVTGTSAANAGAISAYNAGGEASIFGTTGSSNSGYGANLGVLGTVTNIPQVFVTNNTERARIDSSGNLLVGTTSGVGRIYSQADGSTQPMLRTNDTYTTSATANTWSILRNGNQVGTVTTTLSATAYNTSSDYRLKENVQPMTGALAKVAELKPCTYTWKSDGSAGQGFIAHELQEVVPDAVTGEKDAVDADGNPVYQGIDTSFLVATLTAAIQELKAELDITKAKVAALEAQ